MKNSSDIGGRRPKFKTIVKRGKVFLHRLSLPFRDGSIKVHLILNDDVGDPHIHPWEFTSFLLLGAYREEVGNQTTNHWPLSVVRTPRNKRHRVILYRLFGFKVPCLTIGRYGPKIQEWCEQAELCDFCKPHGKCLDKEYWKSRAA
jgi:hypothetical protein